MTDPTVLIVEDRAEDADLTRTAFLEAGLNWNFRLARDGIQATDYVRSLASARAPVPDMILLDLNLPGKDGRTLLTELKQDAWLKDVPIIVMTGSRSEEDIESCHRSGAASFVFKPTNWDQYRAMVGFIREFWRTRSDLPPIWVNDIGNRSEMGYARGSALLAAARHLAKAQATANGGQGFGWREVLLITLNLKYAWEALTSFGEEEIRAETGLHKDLEREAPWFKFRLVNLEGQLIQLEGRVASLTYEMETLSKPENTSCPPWLRSELEGVVSALKDAISRENEMIADQFIDIGASD